MRRIVLLVALAFVAHGAWAAPATRLRLAHEGTTPYRIAVPPDATEPERHAAAELASFLKQSTGAEFPVVTEAEAGSGPLILVGAGPRAKALARQTKFEELGPEEFVISTHPPHLVLAGGRPRGTLYAVYTFLEDHVGCRWFSSAVSRIPSRPTLTVGPLRVHRKPVFEYREPFAFDSFDGDWAARNKCNGHSARLEQRHGGQITYRGFVHTFFPLVPPDRYFATHPEYYSEINGTRTTAHSQLCLTNPEVVDVVTQNVLEMVKDAPPATIVSVSQNDWQGWCECARCKAVEAEEGGVSGPLIRFVNQVAERVGKVRPDVAIDTLAYQKSRQPPRLARPRPNVIVRLCSIECSFAKPLAGKGPNRPFAADIQGWSKICQRLYIWDYVTDFANYVQPHPNFRVLQPNLAFFAAHGVKGVFEQGSYQSPGGEFQELRSWVLAKLLWNPKADSDALVDEFLAGYYGPAAGPVRKYFDLIHDAVGRSGDYLGCYSPPTAAFLSADTIAKADKLWEAAEQAAAKANDPALLQRVRVGRLPVYYVMIVREAELKRVAGARKPTLAGMPLRQRFFEVAAAAKMTHIAEGRLMDDFRAAAVLPERHDAAPPPGCDGLAAGRWFDFQDDEFRLARPGEWVRLTPDPAASDGVAARMPGGHNEWAVALPLDAPALARSKGQRWRMAVAVRVEKTGQDGVAFTYGLYDGEAKKGLGGGAVKAADINGDGYGLYEVGTHEAGPQRYLWVAPAGNAANVPAVWVDRFVLVAPE